MPVDATRFTGLSLDPATVRALEAVLPRMAERSVAAIIAEVPAYTDPFRGRMGQNIENAVRTSIGVFLRLATRAAGQDLDAALAAALGDAYELGRGEARSGRSIDALLAAFRVGARVAWRELSAAAVAAGVPAATIARFAEMVFAYIDELSASSVSGHTDELAASGRLRQRRLDLLTRHLLGGQDVDVVCADADAAAWPVPATLTAVLVPVDQTSRLATRLAAHSLILTDDLPGLEPGEPWAAVLVPDVDGPRRAALLAALAGRTAVVGPARPWLQAQSSYRRAVRARHLVAERVCDTDEHLVELVLTADADAVADLRARALAPLAPLGARTVERLAATLASWLLNQGRREAVAAELFVHPQTVRYRMTQIRQAYGDRLDDPRTIRELTIALAAPRPGRPDYISRP